MSGQRGGSSGFVWPGFGLVMGAALGSVLGLLLFPDLFFLGTGSGAGIGLVVGAIIERSLPGEG